MKHKLSVAILLLTLMLSFLRATASSAVEKTIPFHFSSDEFNVQTDQEIIKHITCSKELKSISDNGILPSFTYSISIPKGYEASYSYSFGSPKLIREKVILKESAPLNTTVNTSSQICNLSGKSEWDDETYLYFRISPFIYDAPSKELFLVEDIELKLICNHNASAEKQSQQNTVGSKPNFIRRPYDSIPQIQPIDTLKWEHEIVPSIRIPLYYDYVIVTNEDLKEAFQPLADWKKAKGLKTAIFTVEEIAKRYSGKDLAAKIKNFLRVCKLNNKIKYVLLGGDETIVPARYCVGDSKKNKFYIEAPNGTPADIYYACFDKYDWDRNGNGIYGEPEDSISIAPSFAVTRLPLKYDYDVMEYVDRVLDYEITPRWTNNILIAGKDLRRSNEKGDPFGSALHFGYELYETFMKDDWSGSMNELFDDSNAENLVYAPKNPPYFRASVLQKHLEKGYSFVDIITHGEKYSYETEGGQYTTDEASVLRNPNHSIIISAVACETNAFDYPLGGFPQYPLSLSQAFITNPYSGVVGFYSPSRYGYYNTKDKSSSPSHLYECSFYEALFGDYIEEKNFGSITNGSKYDLLSNSSLNSSEKYNRYHWLYYGLNPIGDPEMPIYTEVPQEFSNIQASITDRTLDMLVGEQDATVSVLDIANNSTFHKVFTNKESVSVNNLPDQFIVCVTKHNNIPWLYGYNMDLDGSYAIKKLGLSDFWSGTPYMRPILGKILNAFKVNLGCTAPPTFEIETHVKETAKSAYIEIWPSISGSSSTRFEISGGVQKSVVTLNKYYPDNTVYFISLVVDGNSQDSSKTI